MKKQVKEIIEEFKCPQGKKLNVECHFMTIHTLPEDTSEELCLFHETEERKK